MSPATKTMSANQRFKPFTLTVFIALIVATWLDWYWPWGLLFVYWAVPGILSGEAFLVERIMRAGFGLWTIYADIAWRLG